MSFLLVVEGEPPNLRPGLAPTLPFPLLVAAALSAVARQEFASPDICIAVFMAFVSESLAAALVRFSASNPLKSSVALLAAVPPSSPSLMVTTGKVETMCFYVSHHLKLNAVLRPSAMHLVFVYGTSYFPHCVVLGDLLNEDPVRLVRINS